MDFLLPPSGIRYDELKTESIVFLELNENNNLKKISDKTINPSSEWRFHQDIYIEKKDAQAIVHAHSANAAAVSAHGKNIPAFHYMVALAGGNNIKCAEYATFGTKELSHNIIKALEERKACLMSNHGQVAFGKSLSEAFELAEEIENICHQYINTIKLGKPKILSDEEMKKILDKTKNYKKN
jgi:Ribulose-5-phosphate 4-epimerase and related epimerases and aldolases